MSRTLTLVHASWESVRATAEGGRRADALNRLTLLLARPDLPAALAADGHRLAGELALALDRHATARRHLKAAAALEPAHAGARYLCGRAWEEDPDGCDRRAAICFRKAAALEPANPLYRAAFGRAAARCGKAKLGAREMLAAAGEAPGDAEVVRVAVGGLLDAGRPADARRVLTRAKFLRPNDRELAMLWERVKFEAARLAQSERAKTRGATRHAQDAPFATEGDRVVLPFVRIADGTRPAAATKDGTGGAVRRDTISLPRPHLAKLRARRADR